MDSIKQDFAAAVKYQKSGQLAEAESLYAKILQQDKDHISSLINQGIIYKGKGNLEGAILLYKRALFLEADNLAANYQLAVAMRALGHLDEAVQHYKRALAAEPFDGNLLYQTGAALLQQEKLDEAIFFFKQALKIAPDSTHILMEMGNSLVHKGQIEAGMECYQKILSISPNSVQAYSGMGMALVRQNRLNEGLDSFERGLKIDPNNKNAKIWSFFVKNLLSGASQVRFTYQGVPVMFCITGKNLAVELAYMAGQFYEVSELEFVRQNIGPDSVIADVGCNTGNHLVYFAKFVSAAKVIPLEFHPRVIELLKKNISLNEIASADLSKLGCAVGCRRGKASLKEHPAQDLCLTEVWETEDGEIDILPLDELIAEKVDLIKIDVQSLEIEVLQGARRLIAEYKPDLLVEVTKFNEPLFQTLIEILGYAVAKKFEYKSYINFYLKPAGKD